MKTRTKWSLGIGAALLAGLLGALAPQAEAAANQMQITFGGYTNRTEALTNFPVLVVLSNNVGQNFTFADFVTTNGTDLRFGTNSTPTTNSLNYEIESWNTNAGQASYVWVQVPLIPTNGTGAIWANWGNTSASNQLACTTNGATWTNAYAGVWHLGETSGVALDATSNRNNGVLSASGVIRGATGRVDGAYVFSGNQSSLDCGTNGSLNVGYASWEAWVNPTNITTTYDNVIGKGYNLAYWFGLTQTGGKIRLHCGGGTGNAPLHDSTSSVPTNRWTHIMSTWDGTNVRHYINGVLDTTLTETGAPKTNAGKNAHIGADFADGSGASTNLGYNFPGQLDEIRVSGVPRSSNWVWACYLNQASNTVFSNYGAMTSQGGGGAPSILNQPVASVATNSATFNGMLTSTGSPPAEVVYVLWGENTNSWANTNSWTGGGWTNNTPFSTNIASGISADKTYYYTFGASNTTTNVVAGSLVSFITGEVTVEATDNEAQYPGNTGQFTIRRPAGSTNEALTVPYTLGGSAVSNTDYTLSSWSSVTLAAGATSVTVTAVALFDADPGDETVVLSLSSGGNYPLGGMNQATVTVKAISVKTWDGGGATANASNPTNWSGDTLPTAGDHILLDGTTNKSMIWDAPSNGLPDTVASWWQTEAYTGTTTFRTVYGPTGFTNFTVTGDVSLRRGAWMQTANPAGNTAVYRLAATVGGSLYMTNATISAMGCGYTQGNGPGANSGTGNNDGGAHGGMSGYGNTKVYGSIVAPTNLGSAGWNDAGSKGGGAILLTVAGTTTVASAGVVTANANEGGGGAGGAGGSVFLTTGWLTGVGTLRANGRNGSGASSGGGGRVAIVLTGAGADFANWSGANQALGGSAPVGGAGTVYRRTASGVSELIIDNKNAIDQEANGSFNWGPLGNISTLMPSDVNLHSFSNVVIRNNGVLGIKGDTTVDFSTFAPTVYGATNSFISINTDTNAIYPADWTISGYTLFPNNISTSRLVNITVETNGAISHIKASATGLNLSIPGNLTVRGKIDADGRGYALSRIGNGKGIGSNPYTGAAYGGGSLYSTTLLNTNTYGSILAPVDIGSSGEHGDGGGLIRLTVAGTTTVSSAGMISANAWGHNYDSQGSGGSVNLRTGWLTGDGTIRANGTTSSTAGSGGGGRVAVVLTGAGADFSTWTGANTASGGGAPYQAAAGTVYRQAASDGAGAGTVIVNNGATVTNRTTTSLPAFLNQSENLKNTSWVTTNNVRLGLTTNAAVASLTLNANGSLELAGWTLTTRELTVTNKIYRNGIYTPAEISLLTDGAGGGQVVVAGGQGTIFTFR